MNHARDAIEQLRAGVILLARMTMPPDRAASRRMVAELNAMDAQRDLPAEAAMEALRQRLLLAFMPGRKPNPLRRDLRAAPWVLWNGTPQGAAIPGLVDAVFTAGLSSRRVTRALIEAWLRDYRPNDGAIHRGGMAITRLLAGDAEPSMQSWRGAQLLFELFDAARGPGRVASALTAWPKPVPEVFAAAGLDDPFRANGGYMREVLKTLLAAVPVALRGSQAIAALERVTQALVIDGQLRFGRELRGEIGRGLLLAWLDGGREPTSTLRDPVRDFLLRHLGDPRLRTADWAPVGEEGTSLMRRWLARASLKAFFDLIADHAYDAHWRYREAFWSACLDRGAIDDAWLALGHRVHASAQAVQALQGAYGALAGASGDQSVLLMRIGPLVLCEWSHNGKLRAWPADWANAPVLHRESYSKHELGALGLPFPPSPTHGSRGRSDGTGLSHIGSANSVWQGSAAELIARRAKLHLTEADWMPR